MRRNSRRMPGHATWPKCASTESARATTKRRPGHSSSDAWLCSNPPSTSVPHFCLSCVVQRLSQADQSAPSVWSVLKRLCGPAKLWVLLVTRLEKLPWTVENGKKLLVLDTLLRSRAVGINEAGGIACQWDLHSWQATCATITWKLLFFFNFSVHLLELSYKFSQNRLGCLRIRMLRDCVVQFGCWLVGKFIGI